MKESNFTDEKLCVEYDAKRLDMRKAQTNTRVLYLLDHRPYL